VRAPRRDHDGGDSRIPPLFPELEKYLLESRDVAEAGAEYFIARSRNLGTNLRTYLLRTINKAGLKPWPKLFHNLRASRQTELEEMYPTHVVCAWLGNSLTVARKHYLQVTDEHFDRATERSAESGAADQREPSQPVANDKGEQQRTPGFAERCQPSREAALAGMAPVGLEPTRFKGDGF
jgi:hypothetical protein